MKNISTLFALMLATSMSSQAATISLSSTAPTVDGSDIAQLTSTTGLSGDNGDVWGNRPAMGQSFTTLSNPDGYSIDSFSFKSDTGGFSSNPSWGLPGDMQYTFRIGTISGTTFSSLASGTSIPVGSYTAGDWFTMTFDSPVTLSANTEYAIDILHDNTPNFGGWRSAGTASSVYAGGTSYASGVQNAPLDDSNLTLHSFDRTFHVNLAAIPEPSSTALLGLGLSSMLLRRRRS